MTPTRSGSVKFFKLLGITVFIHWSWFIIAVYDLQDKTGRYTSMQWKVWEYLVLFGLVTVHEFGHALACRSVGGKADTIVLWPLGGVAYVDPPQRPGATLWSIAAGPLVNVLFFPIFSLIYLWARNTGLIETEPNAYAFIRAIWFINTMLLVFNMMPIYPLDGGQILRSVLWFMMGKARSLFVATIIGMGGVVLLVLLAFALHSVWIGIMSAFILMNCWSGLRYARALSKIAKLPKHAEYRAPRVIRHHRQRLSGFAGHAAWRSIRFRRMQRARNARRYSRQRAVLNVESRRRSLNGRSIARVPKSYQARWAVEPILSGSVCGGFVGKADGDKHQTDAANAPTREEVDDAHPAVLFFDFIQSLA